MDAGGRATQEAKAEAGIQSLWFIEQLITYWIPAFTPRALCHFVRARGMTMVHGYQGQVSTIPLPYTSAAI